MKRLSKQDERKILNAIDKAAEYVQDGSHPNDAIAKAASDANVRPGHVRLMVNAYNTGQTNAHREEGKDALEKAATFELADTATILEKLYPSHAKTASQQYCDTAISDEYSRPPYWLEREKKAELASKPLPPIRDRHTGDPVNTEYQPYPRDAKEKMARAFYDAEFRQRQVEESRRMKSAAYDRLREVHAQLADYFRQPGSHSFGDVEKRAEEYFGQNGRAVVESVRGHVPEACKQAATGVDLPLNEPPCTLIAAVIDATRAMQQKQAAYEKMASETLQRTTETLRPFSAACSASVLGDPSWEGTPATEKTALSPLGLGVGVNTLNNIARTMEAPDRSPDVQQYVNEVTDPAHDAEIRKIKSQAMLNSLMADDPVISGYDPEEVAAAYSDIVDAAPRTADNKVLMRAMLRKHLEQGSLDSHDVDQLLGVEEGFRKRDEGITKAPMEPFQVPEPKKTPHPVLKGPPEPPSPPANPPSPPAKPQKPSPSVIS